MGKSLPSLSEAPGKQGQEPGEALRGLHSKSPDDGQELLRLSKEFWSCRSLGKTFLQSGSCKADGEPGKVTAQLQPQHKLTPVTALILQSRQENLRILFVLKFSIHSFVIPS